MSPKVHIPMLTFSKSHNNFDITLCNTQKGAQGSVPNPNNLRFFF